MHLDIDFIVYSCLLLASLIPLYIIGDKIIAARKTDENFQLFLKDLKIHLAQHHSKINFNFSIIEKAKKENDMKVREAIIVENIVNQFFYFEYLPSTQDTVSRDKLWQGYEDKSKSSSKYPSDWTQRKELAWKRDDKRCDRCGQELSLKSTYTHFAKKIEEGGGYNLENIIILCQDCNNVLNSKNPKSTITALSLYEKLMLFVRS